jgi:hypothetical protein
MCGSLCDRVEKGFPANTIAVRRCRPSSCVSTDVPNTVRLAILAAELPVGSTRLTRSNAPFFDSVTWRVMPTTKRLTLKTIDDELLTCVKRRLDPGRK